MRAEFNYVTNMWKQIHDEAAEIVKLGGGDIPISNGYQAFFESDMHYLSRKVIEEARKITDAGYGNIRIGKSSGEV